MVKIRIKDVYGIDLRISKLAVVLGLSADINVDCKIKVESGNAKVKLSLDGTFVHSTVLSKIFLEDKRLKYIENRMAEDIKEIVRDNYNQDEVDRVFFAFENYLLEDCSSDKIDKFLMEEINDLVRVSDDIIDELNQHRYAIVDKIKIPYVEINVLAEPRVRCEEIGIVNKDGKMYVPKRVLKQHIELLFPYIIDKERMKKWQ